MHLHSDERKSGRSFSPILAQSDGIGKKGSAFFWQDLSPLPCLFWMDNGVCPVFGNFLKPALTFAGKAHIIRA
jgi:hypothetical protein